MLFSKLKRYNNPSIALNNTHFIESVQLLLMLALHCTHSYKLCCLDRHISILQSFDLSNGF